MTSKRELREELKRTQEALDHSLTTTRIAAYAVAESIEPSAKDIEKFAKDYPKWSISWAIQPGGWGVAKMVKTFTRDIDDLRPELHDDQETYLRLADPEYFDEGLRDVFQQTGGAGTYFSADGIYRGKANGDFDGGEISLSIEGEAGLSRLDLIRVELAEQYLDGENLFVSDAVALGR